MAKTGQVLRYETKRNERQICDHQVKRPAQSRRISRSDVDSLANLHPRIGSQPPIELAMAERLQGGLMALGYRPSTRAIE